MRGLLNKLMTPFLCTRSRNILSQLEFYNKCAYMTTNEMSKYKDEYLKKSTGGYIYKFVQFTKEESLNSNKLDSLRNKEVWFGCPWTMNDPTEFFFPKNSKEFVSKQEEKFFDYQVSLLFEEYNLCSFSIVCDEHMWKEYGNFGNGFCIRFKVNDYDWFYPVEYVDDKENYSYVELWRKANNQNVIKQGEIPNIVLAYLPYVVKDRINKSTGKNSESEHEIRAIYCTYSEDNENNGLLIPGFKKDNNIFRCNVAWEKLNLEAEEIIIGDKCKEKYKDLLMCIARELNINFHKK